MRCMSLLTSMVKVLVLVQVCTAVRAQVDVDNPNITISPGVLEGLRYRLIGPTRGGRVTAVTGFPNHLHRFLMGSTGGGVWQTDDAGQNWANISDKFFKVGSIGAIAVADSDPNVVYVGTGSSQPRETSRPASESTDRWMEAIAGNTSDLKRRVKSGASVSTLATRIWSMSPPWATSLDPTRNGECIDPGTVGVPGSAFTISATGPALSIWP